MNSNEPQPTADFEVALERLDGNRRLMSEMIDFFREDTPQLLADLDAGLASGDATQTKRAAHSIKGLASSFEAQRVMSVAAQIEKLAANNQLDEIPAQIVVLQAAIDDLNEAFGNFQDAS